MWDLSGFPAKKPWFMEKKRPELIQTVSESSENDGEWMPSAEKKRKKKKWRGTVEFVNC